MAIARTNGRTSSSLSCPPSASIAPCPSGASSTMAMPPTRPSIRRYYPRSPSSWHTMGCHELGAYIYIADAALVTEDNLAALGDTLFITRLPATYSECERVIGEAVARNCWEEVGVLAQTP